MSLSTVELNIIIGGCAAVAAIMAFGSEIANSSPILDFFGNILFKLIITFLAFGIGIWASILKDNLSSEEQKESYKTLSTDYENSSKDLYLSLTRDRSKSDSTITAILAKYGYKVDSINKTITKIKINPSPELKARLDLSPPNPPQTANPYITSSNDTTFVNIGISNFGNSTATNLVDKNLIIGHVGPRRFFGYSDYSVTNRGITVIPESQQKTQVFQMLSYYVPKSIEEFYFAFSLKYSNEKNKNQDSLLKIFYVKGSIIGEPMSHNYDSIYAILVEKKFFQ